MIVRRETTQDWFSQQVYQVLPLSSDLQWIKEMFPEQAIMEAVKDFYDPDMGRPSEDPVLLTKILFLSFYFNTEGDDNTLETLKYRMDWRQFCDLNLDAPLPDRTTLVKFRRRLGLPVIETLFNDLVQQLVGQDLIDLNHRFFDGTPVKARASINCYRDEIYEETLDAIADKLEQFKSDHIELDPELNSTPVNLEKETYPVANQGVESRHEQEMKSVSERVSAGDPEAHFQRGKQGKKSELGYEIFFTTDGKDLFITEVDVSAEASQGQTIFSEKLDESQPGQQWSVDAEFSTGELLEQAEEQKVILNTPPRPAPAKGVFPKTEFAYDADSDSYTCPQGETLEYKTTNKKDGSRHYRPAKGTCEGCPFKDQCTKSANGRTISRSRHEEAIKRNREHAKTPQAVTGKVLRGIIAEGKFAEAV